MLSLFLSLAVLGLSAIDPVGIAIMPVLLTQKNPYKRSIIFLTGSFSALLLMGLVFSKGGGTLVLRFEKSHTWFIPLVERGAGIILVCIAIMLFVRFKAGKSESELPTRTLAWLELNNIKLLILGGLIVTVQSVIDVVFVIAMVRTGQYKLSFLALLGAVATYAVAALLIQIAVLITFRLTPQKKRVVFLNRVQKLLSRYSSHALIAISLILGFLLLSLAS